MSSKNQWYIQFDSKGTPDADTTTSLGPMPIDAVISLAQCGSILPQDRVREGRFGKWLRADEVPGVFDRSARTMDSDDQSVDVLFESATSSETSHAENDRTVESPGRTVDSSVVDRRQKSFPRPKSKRKSLKKPPAPVADDSNDNGSTANLDEVHGLFGDLGVAPLSDDLDFELDLPTPVLPAKVPTVQNESVERLNTAESPTGIRDTVIEQPLQSGSARFQPSHVGANEAAPIVELPDVDELADVDESVDDSASSDEAAFGLTEGPLSDNHDGMNEAPREALDRTGRFSADRPAPPAFSKPQKPPRPGRKRSRVTTILVRGAITLAAITGGVFAIQWVASPSLNSIEASFVRLHEECITLRATSPDAAVWSSFTERARQDLDEYVPWLEATALPGERRKSLLLYVGRDLTQMIAVPPDAEVSCQRRLNGFIQQLDEMSPK